MYHRYFKSLALCLLVFAGQSHAVVVTGSGASLPVTVYTKWASEFKFYSNHHVNYSAVGSVPGMSQLQEKAVTFASTDIPLKSSELGKDFLQFPVIMSGVVPVFNLPGFKSGELRITGEVLAEIYLGKITTWNDAQLAVLNRDKKLPNTNIGIVTRSDGSGTTYAYTDYLSEVSRPFRKKIGVGSTVKWQGYVIGAKGNDGVAATVSRVPGTIGYVAYSYAKSAGLNHFMLQNKEEKFVLPSRETFATAAAQAIKWHPEKFMKKSLVNADGDGSWPIVTASYVVMRKEPKDAKEAEISKAALEFFEWSFKNGQTIAEELDFVVLPESAQLKIKKDIWSEFKY